MFEQHVTMGLVPEDATGTAPVHPLQLYFAASGLLLTGVALWHHRRKRWDGEVALGGLLLFSISAGALESFRADDPWRTYWGRLPQLEWTALAMTAASLSALGVAELAYRRGLIHPTKSARGCPMSGTAVR